jgi:ribosome assembly protein SQT1
MVDRTDRLARALSKEFGWEPNQGTEWDKVAGIFALNTVREVCLKRTSNSLLTSNCYRLIL